MKHIERVQRGKKWKRVFAWRPVKIDHPAPTDQTVWLEVVEMREAYCNIRKCWDQTYRNVN